MTNPLSKLVEGEYAAATVHFITYQDAILALPEINFGNDKDMEVYGTVTAHCVRDYKCGDSTKDCQVLHSTTLYAQPQNQPLIVEPLGIVGIYRSFLPVPAYAFLLIEMDIWIHDDKWEHFKGVSSFHGRVFGVSSDSIDPDEDDDFETCAGGFAILQVRWGYAKAPERGKLKGCIEESHSCSSEEEKTEDQQKKPKT